MGLISRTILAWMPLAAAITILSVLIYAAVQQNYRQSLNDPQIQMAEDAAFDIDHRSTSWESIVPQGHQIPVGSLTPWIAITDREGHILTDYDDSGDTSIEHITAVATTLATEGGPVGYLDIPKGVLDYARSKGQNRLTWQPYQLQQDFLGYTFREAIVVVPLKDGGYVVAGRNMREVEEREGRLCMMVLLAWLAAMGASLLFKAVESFFLAKMRT